MFSLHRYNEFSLPGRWESFYSITSEIKSFLQASVICDPATTNNVNSSSTTNFSKFNHTFLLALCNTSWMEFQDVWSSHSVQISLGLKSKIHLVFRRISSECRWKFSRNNFREYFNFNFHKCINITSLSTRCNMHIVIYTGLSPYKSMLFYIFRI